jgi:hypothetical protein
MSDYPPEYDLLTEADVEDDRMCECGRSEKYEQHDYYGIYAGRMCDQCFKEKYKQGPYFDPAYAGESLEEGEW